MTESPMTPLEIGRNILATELLKDGYHERAERVAAGNEFMSDEPAVRACVAAVGAVPMLLFCPTCGLKHIDEPDERTPEWTNPPHKSHLCHGCGTIWRPADVPTNGVEAIETTGKADTIDLNALAALALPSPVRQGEDGEEDMGVAPLRGPGHSAEPEPASAVSSADAASTPNAALDELRSAAAELARRCEIDSCADWPQGVDGSYLDRVRAAIDATYPVIWTEEQVAKLNEYQAGYGHPFTCGSGNRMDAMHAFMRGEDEEDDFGQLIATPQGWSCPACDYRQFWAHDFMFNGALPNPFASVDRSGEADETALAGSAEGESAVGLQAETPDPDFTGHIDCPEDEGGRG